MKKLVFLSVMLFAFGSLFAQLEEETILFEAQLETVFELTVVNGGSQVAYFNDANDYNFGVVESPGNQDGIDPGTTDLTMETTGNWRLLIRSEGDFVEGATGDIIPIANLGVYVSDNGGNHTLGTEVTSTYLAGNPYGLVNATDEVLIDNLGGNSGTALDNAFRLHWEMGTMNGSMLGTSMLEQMANGDFGPGVYNTSLTLTLDPI